MVNMGEAVQIPVYQPYLGGNEKKYVNECLDSNWISSRGSFVDRFEEAFSNYIGSPYVSTVSNGTVALHVALEALGITDGDEVIVPTFTYVASVNTIMQTGATPIFVECDAETLQVDVNSIEKKITSKTEAIMAVHLYGHPCEMQKILELCKTRDLLLVEDCAEALGSRIGTRHVGTYGDVATFSFFGNKTITTGEGGMVVSPHKKIIEKVNLLKSQAVSKEIEYWHSGLGYNYRMTNICAAIGLAQLEAVDKILKMKRSVASFYQTELTELPLRHHSESVDTTHSYWMNSIILDDEMHRDALRKHLKEAGIETRPFFYPANQFDHCKTEERFAVSERLSKSGINLPSYPILEPDQLLKICNAIKNYFGGNK